MTVTVDSDALPIDQLGYTTVGDVLSHVQTRNRLVTQVLIDGRSPDLDRVATLRRQPLVGHTVFVETTDPRKIAIEVLDSVERQMDEADETRETVLDHLAANEPNRALQKLSGCFTSWQSAQQAIEKVGQLLKVDLEQITLSHTTLGESLSIFADQLRAIRDALEGRDYVTLSDILTYEIAGTISDWRGALVRLREIVG